MASSDRLKRTLRNPGVLFGLALLVVGAILAAFAYDAHAEIGSIGDTDDPALLDRLDALDERRTALVVFSAGSLFLGAFGIAVLSQPSLPAGVSGAQMVSAARAYRSLAEGMALEGNAVYLPARHGLTRERVFAPAAAEGGRPPEAATDEMSKVTGQGSSTMGMLVDPPGRDLLAAIERDRMPVTKGMDLEAVEGGLQMLRQGLGMMRDFHLKEREGKLVLRVEYGGLLDACRAIRKEMPDTCRRMQCVGCSCILTAVTRATDKAVRVESVDNSEDRVVFTLSLFDW